MSILWDIINSLTRPTPARAGEIGESSVTRDLLRLRINNTVPGKVLRNIYIPYGNGKTTEIDVLFITTHGLFVIESKNYHGYIFGDDRRKYWTVTYYAGKNMWGNKQVDKYQFYNPIWQNNTHINVLRRFLRYRGDIESMVVFSDTCEIKSMENESADVMICHQSKLRENVYHLWDMMETRLSEDDINNIATQLEPYVGKKPDLQMQHAQQVQAAKSNSHQYTFCPNCGGKLVVRTSKNGPNAGNKFYGCSNFPNCRYTRNIAK